MNEGEDGQRECRHKGNRAKGTVTEICDASQEEQSEKIGVSEKKTTYSERVM